MNKQLKHELKIRAVHFDPVVIIGTKGLTPAVHEEIENSLMAHELIKVRINAADRFQRKAFTEEICKQHTADLINAIGHVVIIYRKAVQHDKKN